MQYVLAAQEEAARPEASARQDTHTDQLRASEQKQVKEANLLVDRTAQVARAQMALGRPWGLENPTHGPEDPSLWDMPQVKVLLDHPETEAVDFDQCRFGCETVKPTRFV